MTTQADDREKQSTERTLDTPTSPQNSILGHQSGTDSKEVTSRSDSDTLFVDWDGPEDPKNPLNWHPGRKWLAVLTVSAFAFVVQLASSMIYPALPLMAEELNVAQGAKTQMLFSIYLLAECSGPFLLSPLSEMFGRTPVLQLSNVVFLVFTLACGFAQTGGQILAFRLIAGFGGSASGSVGGGTIGDTFPVERRGTAVSVYTVGPLIAPAIGPIMGGLISGNISWRWIFWVTAIMDAVVLAVAVFTQKESRAPVLLARKAKALRRETGKPYEVEGASHASLGSRLRTNLVRPLRLLTTQPIVMALAVYMGFVYGINYLMTSSFATIWTERYGQSTQISGVHYVALAIGNLVGAILNSLNDRVYKYLRARNGGEDRPEYRVLAFFPSAIMLPVGLLWYGWSAQAKLFWIMPDIGAAFISASVLVAYCGAQTYVIDVFTTYAASATAAMSLIRNLAGFGFPL